jgi:hypothetical protein
MQGLLLNIFIASRKRLMDVIRAEMPFQYLTLSLLGQFSYDLAKVLAYAAIQHLTTIIEYPDKATHAVQNRMT